MIYYNMVCHHIVFITKHYDMDKESVEHNVLIKVVDIYTKSNPQLEEQQLVIIITT